MTQLDTFLTAHDVSDDVRERLAAAGITSLRDAYDRAAPDDLISIITSPGVMSQRDSVRIALHCVETVQDQLTDKRSRAVTSLLHRWLDDPSAVTQEELTAASDAARVARYAAAASAATATAACDAWYAAACDAWYEAACDARYATAARVARYAAAAAASAAAAGDARYAWYAARVARDDARAERAAWIRENIPFGTLHIN